MSDLLAHDLRDALADQATRLPREASARLRRIEDRPRWRSLVSWPALGALGLGGAAAAAGAAVLLASGAAPAFAGWTASPTAPAPGQLAGAQQRCATSAGTPVLSDT